MMHVEESLRANTNNPAAVVPALAENDAFRQAAQSYLDWAQGNGENPGTGPEVSIPAIVMNSRFTIRGGAIDIELPPGNTYKQIAAFMDDVVAFAAKAAGLEE